MNYGYHRTPEQQAEDAKWLRLAAAIRAHHADRHAVAIKQRNAVIVVAVVYVIACVVLGIIFANLY